MSWVARRAALSLRHLCTSPALANYPYAAASMTRCCSCSILSSKETTTNLRVFPICTDRFPKGDTACLRDLLSPLYIQSTPINLINETYIPKLGGKNSAGKKQRSPGEASRELRRPSALLPPAALPGYPRVPGCSGSTHRAVQGHPPTGPIPSNSGHDGWHTGAEKEGGGKEKRAGDIVLLPPATGSNVWRHFLQSSDNIQAWGGRVSIVPPFVLSQERKYKQLFNLLYFVLHFTESNLETLLRA